MYSHIVRKVLGVSNFLGLPFKKIKTVCSVKTSDILSGSDLSYQNFYDCFSFYIAAKILAPIHLDSLKTKLSVNNVFFSLFA